MVNSKAFPSFQVLCHVVSKSFDMARGPAQNNKDKSFVSHFHQFSTVWKPPQHCTLVLSNLLNKYDILVQIYLQLAYNNIPSKMHIPASFSFEPVWTRGKSKSYLSTGSGVRMEHSTSSICSSRTKCFLQVSNKLAFMAHPMGPKSYRPVTPTTVLIYYGLTPHQHIRP